MLVSIERTSYEKKKETQGMESFNLAKDSAGRGFSLNSHPDLSDFRLEAAGY